MIGVIIAAWRDVRAQTLRTVASVLGLAVAVAAVILVDASTVISYAANDQYSEVTFGRAATYQIRPDDSRQTVDVGVRPMDSGPSTLSPAQIEAAAEMESILTGNVRHSSRFTNAPLSLVTGGDGTAVQPVNAMWVSPDFPNVSLVRMVAGSFPNASASSLVPRAVVTENLLAQLGLAPDDAVGRQLDYAAPSGNARNLQRTLTWPLVIDGVASQLGPTRDPLSMVLVFGGTALPGLPQSQPNWLVATRPTDAGDLNRLVTSVLGSDGLPVFKADRTDLGNDIAPLLNQQRLTGQIVAIIVLGVAGLGLLGIGLSGTRERAHEYALRRAIGVDRPRVFLGVVVQTVMEALAAGVISVAIAFTIVRVFSRRLVLVDLPVPTGLSLPVDSAIRGLVAALVVGLLASLLPAIRASQQSVATALRD